MANKPNRVSAESCRKLADAILTVRTRAIVSERWIESQLGQALDSHDWRPGRPGHVTKLAKQVAKLVYNGPAEREALAKKLARLTRQERVRDAVRRFFINSGLEAHGVPVDHESIGRDQLMAAMLSRFVYGEAPEFQNELKRQGVYTLLQNAGGGASHVNRSLLLVHALGSSSFIWAVHLYRPAGAQAELKARMGVFLPENPNMSLLSAAAWVDPAPVLRQWLTDEDAATALAAIRSQNRNGKQERSVAVLNFKSDNSAELNDGHGLKAVGYIASDDRLGAGALDAIGLVQRSALSDAYAAVAPAPKAEHAQAYAEVQDALARFAAIAAAPGLNAVMAQPAGEPALERAPAPALKAAEAPEAPASLDGPESPQASGDPETPDSPETPEISEVPDTSEAQASAPAPDTSEALAAPGDPETPDTPDSPEMPDSLEASQTPKPQKLDADAPASTKPAVSDADGQPTDDPAPAEADEGETPPAQSS
ncbi:hypothetical protein F1654_11335 [Alkalicaulis satelles]|uniref:Uncharacterized protein n=1 Tax=Alkalicaulis satelles TaxID=2609175 RepID=A0A5M6ZF62_9PROT|nr:hypothetical protein [Alkalicaulis satelles]KAA5802407.1 hypothetical protein F1654_11335 [Alkalicaulis satelles]